MCGSNDGGDGGAAEREANRQARIEKATQAVNAIFGKGAPVAAVAPRREDFVIKTPVAQQPANEDGGLSSMLAARFPSAPQTRFDSAGYDAAMAGYQDQVDDNNRLNGAAGERERLYQQVADDTRDYFTSQLSEDAEQALRQKRFQAARAGTFGSSQAIDMQREFDRRNDRGLLDVANRANTAATNMRTADEKSRIDLISRIVNGADQDSATSSALSQLKTNADEAANEARSGRMANVFSGFLDSWQANQAGQGAAAARKKFESEYGNFFGNSGGSSYQGNVTGG